MVLKWKHFFFACIILLPSHLFSQLTISAQVRPRAEYRDGFKTPANTLDEAAYFVEQRSRLTFDWVDSTYEVRLSFQDIRLWGESPQVVKQEDGNTFLNEAWILYKAKPGLKLKIGRQALSYDNQRILGALEWAQQARRHDAVLAILTNKKKSVDLHLGAAFNQDDEVAEPAFLQSPSAGFYAVSGNYKFMQFAWFHQKGEQASFSLLGLNTSWQNQDTTTSSRYTLGGNIKLNLSPELSLAGDAYYQGGKFGNRNLQAYLAGIRLSWKPSTTHTFGLEQISGSDTDLSSSDALTHFLPDFGTNHAHNGFMDYFFVGPSNGTVGVTDVFLKNTFPLKKGSLKVHLHHFLAASEQINGNGEKLTNHLANEVDLVYQWVPRKGILIHLGYSFLRATDSMLELRNRNRKDNHWAWMMISVSPRMSLKKDK
ncbi:MAG: alginate export family protein [Bacteroidota bacterium]